MWRGRERGRGRGRGFTPGSFAVPAAGALTLDRVRRGSRVRVVRVGGGHRLGHRLAALGVVPGAVVTVARAHGPAVLALNGARIAVGRHAALLIEVEEIGP